jgi:hypothetical protein
VADKLFQTMWNRGQGLYALAQPYLAGRRVAELWPIASGDPEHLRQMGATETFVESPVLPALSFADGSIDVIICANFLPEGSAEAHAAWFSEMARVLSPTGWCVLRVPLPAAEAEDDPEAQWADGENGPSDDAQDLSGELAEEFADDDWHREGSARDPGEAAVAHSLLAGDEAEDAGEAHAEVHVDAPVEAANPVEERRIAWRQFMKDVFPAVDVIEEVAFGGVSFRVPGTDDLAIVGDLSPLAAPAEFEIVLCGKNVDALPRLGESLLVPLAGYLEQVDVAASAMLEAGDEEFAEVLTSEAMARAEADQIRQEADGIRAEASRLRQDAERVRDEARLAAVAARDREAARDATIAALREATERQLRRIEELEATVSRTTGERDAAVDRAQSAEESAQELEAAIKRREWDVAGLEREVDRYGRAVAPKG